MAAEIDTIAQAVKRESKAAKTAKVKEKNVKDELQHQNQNLVKSLNN